MERPKHFDAILFWGTASPTLKWYSGITTRISYLRARVHAGLVAGSYPVTGQRPIGEVR